MQGCVQRVCLTPLSTSKHRSCQAYHPHIRNAQVLCHVDLHDSDVAALLSAEAAAVEDASIIKALQRHGLGTLIRGLLGAQATAEGVCKCITHRAHNIFCMSSDILHSSCQNMFVTTHVSSETGTPDEGPTELCLDVKAYWCRGCSRGGLQMQYAHGNCQVCKTQNRTAMPHWICIHDFT